MNIYANIYRLSIYIHIYVFTLMCDNIKKKRGHEFERCQEKWDLEESYVGKK